MAYEIDFVGAEEESKKDADAIALRWKDDYGKFKVVVYDGGVEAQGEKLKQFLEKYYFNSGENKVIDCVICSHSDLDHASGLKNILENFKVNALYINRPWLYVDLVWDKISDGRKTKNSFANELKDKYKYVADLELIAQEKGIPIYEAFQGTVIEGKLEILSPTKEFYLQLLVESEKTPLEEKSSQNTKKSSMQQIRETLINLYETWSNELLREDVTTTAENEMSVVVYGSLDENILLTGDVGIRGAAESIEYAKKRGKDIKDTVKLIQIPHHGGRHNVSPTILDKLVGNKVLEGQKTGKIAVASVAKDSDHPRQMVVNGFTRRGVEVYKNNGNTINRNVGLPHRDGWGSMQKLEFEEVVDPWKD